MSGDDGHDESRSGLGFLTNRLFSTTECFAFTRQRSLVRSQ